MTYIEMRKTMRASKLRIKPFFLEELMQHWTLSTPTMGSWDQSILRAIFEPPKKSVASGACLKQVSSCQCSWSRSAVDSSQLRATKLLYCRTKLQYVVRRGILDSALAMGWVKMFSLGWDLPFQNLRIWIACVKHVWIHLDLKCHVVLGGFPESITIFYSTRNWKRLVKIRNQPLPHLSSVIQSVFDVVVGFRWYSALDDYYCPRHGNAHYPHCLRCSFCVSIWN